MHLSVVMVSGKGASTNLFLSAVFVIAYVKENVLHYIIKSKNTVLAVSIGKIKSSNRDERRHAKCDINTEGSAGAMEPTGHI